VLLNHHIVVLFWVRCLLEIWCGWFWVVFVLQAEAQLYLYDFNWIWLTQVTLIFPACTVPNLRSVSKTIFPSPEVKNWKDTLHIWVGQNLETGLVTWLKTAVAMGHNSVGDTAVHLRTEREPFLKCTHYQRTKSRNAVMLSIIPQAEPEIRAFPLLRRIKKASVATQGLVKGKRLNSSEDVERTTGKEDDLMPRWRMQAEMNDFRLMYYTKELISLVDTLNWAWE